MFGPDDRLYVVGLNGTVDVFSIQRSGPNDYVVTSSEELLDVKNIPNHNDDGSANSNNNREATGLTVAGTAESPVIYVTSSDSRVGGPSGDQDLDTNSGVITRLSWNGTSWEVVDIVRGLSRSEENHATNGLEFVTIDGEDFLIVCSGGHTNAGSPSDNFAWTTEYALSAAILSVNLTELEQMPVNTDNTSGRKYIYDLPTLDDPTRPNANGIVDPDNPGYTGVDVGDPWGGNDGLNQAMIVENGPVQIFSPGYRNSYDLVVTEDGKVFATDNGANGGWGGLPVNEGVDGTVTNDYISSEPGSSSPVGGEQVNNADHLTMITNDLQNYVFGSFYGGHPAPVRANPEGAGLFTNPTANANSNSVFRTLIYDPDGSRGPGYTNDPNIGLPANWPPVPPSLADPREGDWRGPGINNPDGPDDVLVTTWGTNTNGIDEYTASNFAGVMKGNLIAGTNGGVLRRVELDANGNLDQLTNAFISNLGGNPLGITCNGDFDPFPGTIWVATFNSTIKVLEPQDIDCDEPGDADYSPTADNDNDGYTNEDEIANRTAEQTIEEVICNGGNQPNDFDKSAGAPLVSDLNDPDDDSDGISDADDPFQLGDPDTGGSDAFNLPVLNDLFSDNQELEGYLGLGFTGLMNNGAANPNWLNWLDRRDDPNDPNPNDILGGAVGAMTMQMTDGTAAGTANSQEKGFQYGINVDQSTGMFTVEGRLFNFTDQLQLYGSSAPTNGELGLFIGDGTQSNYIQLVLTANGKLEARQENNDVPQTPLTATVTASQDIIMFFEVNPADGTVTLLYTVDGGSKSVLGSLTAQGSILTAMQDSGTPLAVGLIGTSNAAGEEVEGTWDYLYVRSTQPYAEQSLPDVDALINASDRTFDLADYFGDDGGDDNLAYTVASNTSTGVGTNITGSTLTISFPASSETADVTIRATDGNGLFAEQTFTVTVSDEPIPILRIRANGSTLAATDGGNPPWSGNIPEGQQNGSYNDISFAVNTGTYSTQNVTGRHTSLPDYVPQALFTNERYDVEAAPEMEWTFDLPQGNYVVRLYMGNGFNGTSEVGERVFDISIEGQLVEDDLDLVATFGHLNGGMLEYPVALGDGTLNILFEHVTENPLINGIEILTVGGEFTPPITVMPIPDQSNAEGDLVNLTVMASGGDDNENFSFSATGLPTGIQIEPTTGLIFGTIADGASAGNIYNAVVTVSKPGSSNATVSFTWTVIGEFNQLWNDQTDDENYTARHECSFVQAGDKFYLFGGRENSTTFDVYDYESKTWSQIPNSAPSEFNHFQALEYQGLIWVIGAFKTNNFPAEEPADYVWAYNPATDEWIQGPEIPESRKRGSAGLVIHNGKFYVIGGNTIGHDGGYVAWFDEFDPETGVWTNLGNAPRPRDHFHAEVIDGKLYLAGGRLSGGTGGVFAPLIAEVDVYDFASQSWTSIPDLPTPRGAATVAAFKGELYVIGGEIGTDLQGNNIGDAQKTTEAFNPTTGYWSTKPDLITERHGTQAIVSGDGIHVTAGSNSQGGGGTMKNMEFFGTDNPVGTPLTASQLETPGSVSINAYGTSDFAATATGGNTGLIITDMAISGPDAESFYVNSPRTFSLVEPGASVGLTVGYSGTQAGQTATLTITYGNSATATVALNSTLVTSGTVLYRVNAGGSLTAGNDADPTDWSADQSAVNAGGSAGIGTPSSYYNLTPPAQDITYGVAFTGTNNTGYPDELFSTERYSTVPNPDNMQWDFPVENGDYIVNLLFAEVWTGAQDPGTRVFDVMIEGDPVLEGFDQTVAYGWNTAGVETFSVTVADGNLDIDFLLIAQNPNIKGIEILSAAGPPVNEAPVVTTPVGQIGREGDYVSLQIDASDATSCSGLTYTATGLPPSLTIDPSTGLISGTLDVEEEGDGNGAFMESGGLVVIEMESAPILPGSWENAATYSTGSSPNLNNPTSASGDDFIIWQGSQYFNNPGNGLLTYPVEITTPGVYRFQWRSQVANGTDATEHNDTWLKIEADAYYGQQGGSSIVCPVGAPAGNDCTGDAPEGSSSGGWFKIYAGGANNWSWSTNTSDSDAHQIYARFDAPGTYNILVSARSSSHAIDRMVMSHSGYSGNPQSLSLPESERAETGSAGAAANSPYDVVVTVADGCVPSLSTQVNFNWEVVDPQAPSSLTLLTSTQGRTNYGGVHTVELYTPSNLTAPLYRYTPTADASGQMKVSGFALGQYRVLVKRSGFLQRVQTVSLTGGDVTATFGELRAGNLNADNSVSILDFSLLANSFGQSGQISDFNGDGVTNILDFSLQASNYGSSGESVSDN
ncbi:malectin domain-containing carbohydrate-binding protein [Lewinella sp. IMCC34191]|uniref:malectin domain-containing carbohydrate-binding protein n=1 Tax=Lewinella sp. IMCC34191 TaxID=2259172 RepID=UPI001E3F19E3|nr:malectin domain-containing carbohydrate-binding protein [Lewinella sp. IMCC34191]